jgi:hypothetical protein
VKSVLRSLLTWILAIALPLQAIAVPLRAACGQMHGLNAAAGSTPRDIAAAAVHQGHQGLQTQQAHQAHRTHQTLEVAQAFQAHPTHTTHTTHQPHQAHPTHRSHQDPDAHRHAADVSGPHQADPFVTKHPPGPTDLSASADDAQRVGHACSACAACCMMQALTFSREWHPHATGTSAHALADRGRLPAPAADRLERPPRPHVA